MVKRVPFPRYARWLASKTSLVGQIRGRETSISGVESVNPSLSARWEMTAQFALDTDDAKDEWEAFIARMEGGIGVTLAPMYQRTRAGDARGRGSEFASTPAFGTFEHWSFVTTYDAGITLQAAAASRATDLYLTLVDSEGLRPGKGFSIGDRYHRVQDTWTDDDDVPVVRIQPPLREAHALGTELDTLKPVCAMRMVSEAEGIVDHTAQPVDFVSITMREAF